MNRLSTWIREGIGSLERAHTPTIFPSLSEIGTRHYDAIVIGGGAFGITAAYKLKLEGYRVALVEAKTIGSGITSFSTAKVTSLHGTIYSTLVKSHGDATASNYYHMNQRGITLLEEMVVKLSLDCDYDKREHRIWSSDAKEADVILEEYETCRRLGIPCHLLHTSDLIDDLPTTIEPCIALSFPGQSIFNPYKYCQELAKHINGDGSNVVENSRVTNVETSLGTPCKVVCSEENTYITGDKVIVATHLPILDRSLHFAYLQPSKSYCVAARIKNNILEEKLSSSEENVSGTNVSRGKMFFTCT